MAWVVKTTIDPPADIPVSQRLSADVDTTRHPLIWGVRLIERLIVVLAALLLTAAALLQIREAALALWQGLPVSTRERS